MESIILASASPRRRQLLAQIGVPFEQFAVQTDESVPDSLGPGMTVECIAERKAFAASDAYPSRWILSADTLVVMDGRKLGKPASQADAIAMLHALSGHWHEVYTGICLFHTEKKHWLDHESTRVHFCTLSDEDILQYVQGGEAMDKAGAYGIQGSAARFVDRIEGCYYNVVGLPLSKIWKMLGQTGLVTKGR